MKLHWIKGSVISAAAVMLLSACGAQGNNANNNSGTAGMHSLSEEAGVPGHLHDGSIIPSWDGAKTQTTNERGQTTSGMGMNVYSRIGSSSLYSGGISSQIQSRLNGAGIEGVRAIVLNDTVVVAQDGQTVSAHQMDNLQWKLLSPTKGWSGKGEIIDDLSGTDVADNNNNVLQAAKKEISKMFGGDVAVLTVQNPEAYELIGTITSKLHSNAKNPDIAEHIVKLLEMASSQ